MESQIQLKDGEDSNIYAAGLKKRHAMDKRARALVVLSVCLVLALAASILLPDSIVNYAGPGMLSFAQFAEMCGTRASHFIGFLSGDPTMGVFSQTLLKNLAIVLAGMALAVSGAVFQSTTNNPMAAPSTLGVMSGGMLGKCLCIIVGALSAGAASQVATAPAQFSMEAYQAIPAYERILDNAASGLASLAGCAIVVGIVMSFALLSGRGHISRIVLVVVGQLVTMVIGGINSLLRMWVAANMDSSVYETLRDAMKMSFAMPHEPVVMLVVTILMCIGFGILLSLRGKLNLLSFDEDEARSMGISTSRTRVLVVAVCTVLTALTISFCGAVGFLGFIAPHMMRRVVGPDVRYLMPASMLGGSLFLLVTYKLGGLVGLAEDNVGLFITCLCSVIFVVTSIVQRSRGNVDWI